MIFKIFLFLQAVILSILFILLEFFNALQLCDYFL